MLPTPLPAVNLLDSVIFQNFVRYSDSPGKFAFFQYLTTKILAMVSKFSTIFLNFDITYLRSFSKNT